MKSIVELSTYFHTFHFFVLGKLVSVARATPTLWDQMGWLVIYLQLPLRMKKRLMAMWVELRLGVSYYCTINKRYTVGFLLADEKKKFYIGTVSEFRLSNVVSSKPYQLPVPTDC